MPPDRREHDGLVHFFFCNLLISIICSMPIKIPQLLGTVVYILLKYMVFGGFMHNCEVLINVNPMFRYRNGIHVINTSS